MWEVHCLLLLNGTSVCWCLRISEKFRSWAIAWLKCSRKVEKAVNAPATSNRTQSLLSNRRSKTRGLFWAASTYRSLCKCSLDTDSLGFNAVFCYTYSWEWSNWNGSRLVVFLLLQRAGSSSFDVNWVWCYLMLCVSGLSATVSREKATLWHASPLFLFHTHISTSTKPQRARTGRGLLRGFLSKEQWVGAVDGLLWEFCLSFLLMLGFYFVLLYFSLLSDVLSLKGFTD